jgi:hypothetical protein
VPTASTAAVAAPMAPATCEAPLEPEPEALASATVASASPDDSVDDSSERTAAEPVPLVASSVPLEVMFMLGSMPEAAVEAALDVAAAAEEAVDVAADVAATEPAADASVEVWPLTAATARAAMTRSWKTFMVGWGGGAGGLGRLEAEVGMRLRGGGDRRRGLKGLHLCGEEGSPNAWAGTAAARYRDVEVTCTHSLWTRPQEAGRIRTFPRLCRWLQRSRRQDAFACVES